MLNFKLKSFGQLPKGERLEKVMKSANYKNGEFKNLSETPVFSSDKSQFKVMSEFMFKKKIRLSPKNNIPTVKADIKNLSSEKDVLIWFGHSSYFIQLKGKTFLVDPVFNTYASPFSFINKIFRGTAIYNTGDLPVIDYLIITHDHWDHLDYKTVTDLKSKINNIICPLGIGQHFEYWKFDDSKIKELDWYEETKLDLEFTLTATPARHFSGRGLKRNKTLWTSYVLQSSDYKLFISGDGGYDYHFSEIGQKYGPFDLAILEQGQYNENWKFIHLMPDFVFKAAEDLKTKRILPVHNSKFALANHAWDEPLNKITNGCANSGIPVLTPRIGEVVFLKDKNQTFNKWWKGIE